jgi:group II intron reverse transcriptase/maturase
MSLATPTSVQELQTALHGKAKEAASYRFYSLYDKVYRKDILTFAYRRCRLNDGTAGVDGQLFADIQEQGVSDWLDALAQELESRTYRPQPVRRVWIPKPDGQQRPLGIPTIKDRVVQMAAVLVLEPIFEADLQPEQFAYRPGRSAHDAVNCVEKLLGTGHRQVIDADLSGYFDSIPHAELMRCVARRVADGSLLHLLKMWLVTPVEDVDANGQRCRTSRNKDDGRGTPQGAPISPLLSNLYMRRFILGWKTLGYESRLDAHIVNYADDFVICCHGTADAALTAMRAMVSRLKLTVNEAKTHICCLPEEQFDFLGFTFGRYYSSRTGKASLQYWPSRKRITRVCAAISAMTGREWLWMAVPERVATLNRILLGWRGYFARGMFWKAFRAVDRHVWGRLRRWLCRKHTVRRPGGDIYPLEYLYGELGLVSLERTAPRQGFPWANP